MSIDLASLFKERLQLIKLSGGETALGIEIRDDAPTDPLRECNLRIYFKTDGRWTLKHLKPKNGTSDEFILDFSTSSNSLQAMIIDPDPGGPRKLP